MEITDVQKFITYYSRIKQRTIRLFDFIPPDKIEWTYQEGKFTIGDLIRHLANIERYMYAETVKQNKSKYVGCGVEFAKDFYLVVDYYKQLHKESEEIFLTLKNKELNDKCMTPAGIEITIWKWLRAMVEHEVHHRGQLYTYLGILGVKPPPIFGLTSEEVINRSTQ